MPSTITRSLHDTFGLERLRPGQAEVIRAVLNGEDILALMPTGAGKSLCYQVLAPPAPETEEFGADIRTHLGRPNMRVVNTGIYRPNLEFRVEHVKGDDEKHAVLLKLLAETPGTGIIYTATIRHVNDVAAFLE